MSSLFVLPTVNSYNISCAKNHWKGSGELKIQPKNCYLINASEILLSLKNFALRGTHEIHIQFHEIRLHSRRSCSQIKLKVVLLHSALLGWEGQPWLTTFLQLSHCRIPVNTFSDWLLSKRHNLVISLKEESEPHLLTSEFIYTT